MGSSSPQKLHRLRTLMGQRGFDAYLIPSRGEHQSEYAPEAFKRLQWISGFTGSSGTLVVTQKQALLWTDGRYHIQAEKELAPEAFGLMKAGLPGVMGLEEWLAENLHPGQVLGVDPKVVSLEESRRLETHLEPRGVKIRYEMENLVDLIWPDRPALPSNPIWALDLSTTGMSVTDKLQSVRAEFKRWGVSATVLCALDEIAWVLNMRGWDVPYNPVFLSYLMITEKEALLFVDQKKITKEALQFLGPTVRLASYHELEPKLREIGKQKVRFWVDPRSTSKWIHILLPHGVSHLERTSPVATLKAVKNEVERKGMALAHLKDAIALVRFLKWIKGEGVNRGVSELQAARKLEEFRRELQNYKGPSFETIVAWGPNGAIVHYRPKNHGSALIPPHGLLLVDAGAHFLEGTTDVTRTICLGAGGQEPRDRFTRVLKGHIALTTLRFPKGTTGRDLDPVARQYLWEVGLDYRHGTGHGVGCFLNVHEGPQSISPKDPGVSLEAGMFLTIEPGYYEEGKYGIRIENVVEVVRAQIPNQGYGDFLEFRPVTLVPLDKTMISKSLLTPKEIEWINSYHSSIRETLSPHLHDLDLAWLREATDPL